MKPNEKPKNAVAYITAIHAHPTRGEPGYVMRRLEMPMDVLERYTVREDAAEMPQIVISRAESEFYKWHSDTRGAGL